jgi:hypothetical protein
VLETLASQQLGVDRPMPGPSIQDPASPAGIPQLALIELACWAVHHRIPALVLLDRTVSIIADLTVHTALDVAAATW